VPEDINELAREMAKAAREASYRIGAAPTATKNSCLAALARLLRQEKALIYEANRLDLEQASREAYPQSFIDRLRLTDSILETMALGCEQIAALPDPIGEVLGRQVQESGIEVARMRVPLGVLAIIFESRPNVTIDAAALAIKSGNAAILRGGREALQSNRVLGQLVARALKEAQLPADTIQVVQTPDHDFVGSLIVQNDLIDVLIPRGGKKLIARLERDSRIPMLKHLEGICHTYVDRAADIEMAVRVTDNAKTQRYSPCNATETLLVHEQIATKFLPRIGRVLASKGVELRASASAGEILQAAGIAHVPATEADWHTEYNAPILAIALVESLQQAIDFINTNGSKHTDAIITEDKQAAARFLREVDSGSVMHNCSTRLADGFVYGLGAEIGISTGKLHARGPVGLEGLTSLKFVVFGHGEGRH